MFDPQRFISERAAAIDASGIRRVFDLAAGLERPINLSIGQPDFDVPQPIKAAAIHAIEAGRNQYTVTQGEAALRDAVRTQLADEAPQWNLRAEGEAADADANDVLITSGVSGGLVLALLACVGPGDEVIVPDPYFVMYRHLVTLAGATPVYVDTYPDFQLTAERIQPHLTRRTKMILFNSPSNPTGVTADWERCRELVELADAHDLLLLSDEIYDAFCYEKSPRPADAAGGASSQARLPGPAVWSDRILLLRCFSKTYGMTGWRLGWAAGPAAILEQMTKLQQYTFVCAPSMVQAAGIAALNVDMSEHVQAYQARRDRVVQRLGEAFELTAPGGAFYAFPKVPERLGLTATQFVERAVERRVLIIPGSVFSNRDTHFRLSYACDDAMLDEGLDVLLQLAGA